MSKTDAGLQQIKQLERDLDIVIEPCLFDEIESAERNGFSLDETGAVNGLSLYGGQIASAIETITKLSGLKKLTIAFGEFNDCQFITTLQQLTHLNLTWNLITDISFLVKLNNLTNVYLGHNQIADITPLASLKRLSGLDMQQNRITDISVIKELNSLSFLDLSRNDITDISPLKQLKQLIYLKCVKNPIRDISCLRDLGRLKYVTLSSNKINDISCFRELNRLIYLDLAGNLFEDISSLKGMSDLTYLNLSSNPVKNISPLKNLRQLKELFLRHTGIRDISPIQGMADLIDLDLSGNQLTDISALKGLTALNSLDLSDNRLTEISSLQEMTALKELYLASNRLTDISPLKMLSNLEELKMRSNQLTDISALQGLSRLNSLDLNNNQLSNLSGLQSLSQLNSLEANRNRLLDISALQSLKQLTNLYLGYNQLSDISAIQSLTQLVHLYLERNRLTDISACKSLTNLKRLYLCNNRIVDISALLELKGLYEIDLRGNKVKDIPRELFDIGLNVVVDRRYIAAEPNGLYLFDNPIEKPPLEILKEGREAVIAYFDSLERESVKKLNEVKVLLVGDGAVGKTSLVKRITQNLFNPNENQTDGIRIKPWTVPSDGEEILAYLWDFGGQEIMHATHQFFLSQRSMYVLVLNARQDAEKKHTAEYWLKMIRIFGGDSPVIVVINQIDQNPTFDLNRALLHQKFPNIVGFYCVSCRTAEGLDQFVPALRRALPSINILDTQWPGSWFNVKQRLQHMDEHYITFTQLEQICAAEHITEKIHRDTLVGFLHDLGVILHFADIQLKDTHVLNPHWATQAVYRIINRGGISGKRGVLDLDTLPTILAPRPKDTYHFPEHKHGYIIELMKKFELCYSLDSRHVLIPGLLPENPPEFQFPGTGLLRFTLRYDFLPAGVLPRFIVRMHEYIHNRIQWLDGVVLADPDSNATALITADKEDKRIDIIVANPAEQPKDDAARRYLTVIRHTLRDINNRYKNLVITRLVPLPDNPHITVEYDELLGFEESRRDEYFVGKLRKGYSVSQLLNGVASPEQREEDNRERRTRDGDVHYHHHESTTIVKSEMSQTVSQTVNQQVEQNIHIELNLNIELPALQKDFRKLKRVFKDADQDTKTELEKIEDTLLDADPETGGPELIKILKKPLKRLGLFLDELGEEDTTIGKFARATKTGIETAQKAAKTYNKFAKYIPGLPEIPRGYLE